MLQISGLCPTARGRAPQVERHGFEVASHQLWHPMFVVFVVFVLALVVPSWTAATIVLVVEKCRIEGRAGGKRDGAFFVVFSRLLHFE